MTCKKYIKSRIKIPLAHKSEKCQVRRDSTWSMESKMTCALGERSSTEPTPDITATLKPACDASAILRSALVSPTCVGPGIG